MVGNAENSWARKVRFVALPSTIQNPPDFHRTVSQARHGRCPTCGVGYWRQASLAAQPQPVAWRVPLMLTEGFGIPGSAFL